jgi:hypothetical protein
MSSNKKQIKGKGEERRRNGKGHTEDMAYQMSCGTR